MYKKAALEVVTFDVEDVITTSDLNGGVDLGGDAGGYTSTNTAD